jgi:hypothetical protein
MQQLGNKMGQLSIFHWIIVLLILSPSFPIGIILKRDGKNPFWAALYYLPLVNVIALWCWAYSRRSAS